MSTEEWQSYSNEQKKDVSPGMVIGSELYILVYIS